MDPKKIIKKRVRRSKAKNKAKLQLCQGNDNLVNKSNPVKSLLPQTPQPLNSSQANKNTAPKKNIQAIPNTKNDGVKKKSLPTKRKNKGIDQQENQSNNPASDKNTTPILNTHQKKIIEKLNQKINSSHENTSNRSINNNGNKLNPTQLRVLEVIAQKKKQQNEFKVSRSATKHNKKGSTHSSSVNKNSSNGTLSSYSIPKVRSSASVSLGDICTPRISRKEKNNKNSAEKRLQTLRKRISGTSQNDVNVKNEVLEGVTSTSTSHTPNNIESKYLINENSNNQLSTGKIRRESEISIPHSLETTNNNIVNISDCESQQANNRLHNFRKRLSNTSNEINKNNNSMIVDDVPLKRKSSQMSTEAISKRHKVEEIEQLFKPVTENISANNSFDNLNNRSSFIKDDSFCKTPQTNLPADEQMDWESIVEQIIQVRGDFRQLSSNQNVKLFENDTTERKLEGDSKTIFIVVDTNIFISNLKTIQRLTDPSDEAGKYKICVMVPWIVLCELDKLKLYTNGGFANTQVLARKAMRYLHENLSTNPKICGQSVKVASDHMFPCPVADDEILNCCLQLSNSQKMVVLLTNDINLCNKAAVNGIKMFTHKQFFSEFLDSLQLLKFTPAKPTITATKLTNYESVSIINASSSKQMFDIKNIICKTDSEKINIIEMILCNCLSIVLEQEMRKNYDDLWKKIVLVEPPWNLLDILKCLEKHWIAVFKDILPRSALALIKELQRVLLNRTNGPFKISSTAIELVEYFQGNNKYSQLCLKCTQDIKNCLNVIPDDDPKNSEEMTLSKNNNKITPIKFSDNTSIYDTCAISENKCSHNPIQNFKGDSSAKIVNILKMILQGFCKFCGGLANTLKVSHNLNIEDDLSTPLEMLIIPATEVGNQLQLIVNCTSRMISSFTLENLSPDQRGQETVLASEALTNILFDTFNGMGHSSENFNSKEVLMFCTEHRNLILEAYNEFIILHNLIMECSQKYASMK